MSRRTIIVSSVLVVVVMGALGFGLAFMLSHLASGGQSASVTPTPTPTASLTTGGKGNKKGQGKNKVTGVIESLGDSSFVLAVNGKKRTKMITVMVNDATKYSGPVGSASFSDLKVGEAVEVKGTLDSTGGTLQATQVIISPPSSGSPTPTP